MSQSFQNLNFAHISAIFAGLHLVSLFITRAIRKALSMDGKPVQLVAAYASATKCYDAPKANNMVRVEDLSFLRLS